MKTGDAPPRAGLFSFFRFHFSSFLVPLLAGAVTVAAFEPAGAWFLAPFTLACLFRCFALARTPAEGFFSGFGFGLGFFLVGVSWIYVSLHTFGAMPKPLAALATSLFCAFLALFPAVVGCAVARARGSPLLKALLVAPAAWMLIEWTRGWIFTGFPWLAAGYSQAPGSPLAGYAPVFGVYGVSLATAWTAGGLAVLSSREIRSVRDLPHADLKRWLPLMAGVVALWIAGHGLKQIHWTQPTGVVTKVSLLQGNVPQDMKWREETLVATLNTYRDLVNASPGQLIVLPETALPLFLNQVPTDYLVELAQHARANNGDVLIGVPERRANGEYYNTVISLGRARPQFYRKSHLVPFGEFIPLRPALGWIVSILAIPLQDFSRGRIDQQPLEVAGQRVAINICYEDVFGEEIIRQLPRATVLVNASNVAWFGRSIAPQQHLQISQMRALETGRYMLRATNTGVTAVIDERGHAQAVAREFEREIVNHDVPGFEGATPFVRWGNYAALTLACLMLIAASFLARRNRA